MTHPSGDDDHVINRRRRLVADVQDGEDRDPGLIRGPRSAGSPTQPAIGHRRGDAWYERHWTSRALHRFGDASAYAGAGLTAAATVLVWLAVGVVLGFPRWWETVLYATSASVTLVMVFVIQHTQARQQAASQRKLDELLRALPSADNTLIAIEEAPDQELEARATLNRVDRRTEPME